MQNLLYRAKDKETKQWIKGYPFKKDNVIFIIEDKTGKQIEIIQDTLGKQITEEYFEHDVFNFRGFDWILKYCDEIFSFQLTRIDAEIPFNYYLPITLIPEAKYKGNIFDIEK